MLNTREGQPRALKALGPALDLEVLQTDKCSSWESIKIKNAFRETVYKWFSMQKTVDWSQRRREEKT